MQGRFQLLVRNSVHKPCKALKESLKATAIEQNTGNNSHILPQLEREVHACRTHGGGFGVRGGTPRSGCCPWPGHGPTAVPGLGDGVWKGRTGPE